MPLRLAALEGGDSLLTDEVHPAFVPHSECCPEGCFVGLCERSSECEELLPGFRLWSTGEVSPNDLDLVELADLHWYTLKHLDKSSSPVHHGCFEYPAPLFENGPAIAIVCHELACDFMPPDVLRKRPGAEDADPIVAAPERGVGDDHSRMWDDFGNRYDNRVELIAHPDVRMLMLLGKLFKRLLLFDVFLPEFSANSSISSGRLKLRPAVQALVSLQTISFSILLASRIAALRADPAAFLRCMLNI